MIFHIIILIQQVDKLKMPYMIKLELNLDYALKMTLDGMINKLIFTIRLKNIINWLFVQI